MAGVQKVHKSAVCIIPPRSVWAAIQNIRRQHDKSFKRWPPHINLLYPFWQDSADNFELAATQAQSALELMQPFSVTLDTFDYFVHRKSCTLWLRPSETEVVQQLQSRLEGAFPECNDLSSDASRSITQFTPHLSVGQWPTQPKVELALQEFQDHWEPLTFMVDHVAIISRKGFHDPFKIRYTVPMGSSIAHGSATRQRQAAQVDVAYIAE